MKLVKVPHSTVLAATTANPDQRVFNTSFHTAAESPQDTCRPSEAPYTYSRWLPLIARSRHLPTDSVQIVTLTSSQAQLLHDAADASLAGNHLTINRLFIEDLELDVLPTLQSDLVFPPEGLFLRLDATSPKDGAGSSAPLKTPREVLNRLATSQRARNALRKCLDDGIQAHLFALPFDSRMGAEREYRVFCRPGDFKMTGVSQYRWYARWMFADAGEEGMGAVFERVREAAERVRDEIVGELGRRDGVDALFENQGFSFDLLYDADAQSCELVELNGFGARGSCGSCLFQWVVDREVLHGEAEAEFRVAV